MSILIDRLDGRIEGPNFAIERWFTQVELSRINDGFLRDKESIKGNASEKYIIAVDNGDHAICIRAHFRESTLLGVSFYVSWNEQTGWNDWSAKIEEKSLIVLTDILDRSDIENGTHFPWGMANAYYDAREGSSLLWVHYVSKYLTKLPNPMPYTPILP